MPRKSPTDAAKKRESARLANIREKMEMSQREFAKELLVTHRAIGMWERGERTIPGPVLKLMEFYEEKLGIRAKK